MNGITVCVDYSDLLSITLPYNREHFNRFVVVTSPHDQSTIQVARENDAYLWLTESFYHNGAIFNKWRALEEGLAVFKNSDDWLTVMDADILWPTKINHGQYVFGNLYTPRRRIHENLSDFTNGYTLGELLWNRSPLYNEGEFAGYSQIFHTADNAFLGSHGSWYPDWKHAGGGDSVFQSRWPFENKVRPDWECLHLGPPMRNWCGRVTPFTDGSLPKEAEERAAKLREILLARRGKSGDRYAGERL